jgi:hypothetical protein
MKLHPTIADLVRDIDAFIEREGSRRLISGCFRSAIQTCTGISSTAGTPGWRPWIAFVPSCGNGKGLQHDNSIHLVAHAFGSWRAVLLGARLGEGALMRRPTSGNTSTGAFSAPGVQRELDNEAALLRERATLACIAIFFLGVAGGVLLLIGFFRLTGVLG